MRVFAAGVEEPEVPVAPDDSFVSRPRGSWEWRVELSVFLGFLLASVYATWPLARHIATRVPFNNIDSLLNAWIFSWAAHAVVHAPLDLFDANIFFPEQLSFVFTENNLGQSLPLAPIYWLTGNGILTVNVALILLYTVASFGAYRLALELGAGRGPSFVAGIVFGLSPYRLSQIVHIHVIAMHLAPFVVLLFLRLRTRPAPWLVPVIGGTLAFQFWSSLSGGAMTLCAIGAWVLWEFARHRRQSLPVLWAGTKGLLIAGVLVLPLGLLYLSARDAHSEYGHPENEVVELSATFNSYLSPVDGGPVFRNTNRWLEGTHTGEPGAWEKHLFLGWTMNAVLLGMGGAGLWSLRRRRERTHQSGGASLAAAITLVGFVLSLGPRFGADPDGFPLPFELLARAPGRLLRVPARFGSLVALGLALGLAVALSRIPSRWRRPVVGAVLLALAVELMPPQIPTVRAPEITSAHRSISGRAGAVLALPTVEIVHDGAGGATGLIEREPINVYLSTAHFRPMVNGYSAFQPTSWWNIVRGVQDFPSPTSMQVLHQRGVKTVVIQTILAKGTRWEASAHRLSRWPGARLVARARGVVVYDITHAALVTPPG